MYKRTDSFSTVIYNSSKIHTRIVGWQKMKVILFLLPFIVHVLCLGTKILNVHDEEQMKETDGMHIFY